MTTVAEAIKRLKWAGDQHVAVAIWSEEDVLHRAKERGLTVTQKQASQIIDLVDRKQDCSMGISWITIDFFTDEVLWTSAVKKRE